MAQLGEITTVQQASDWFIPASTSFTVDVYSGDVTIQVRRTSATNAMYVGDVVMGQSREITIRGPVSCPLGVLPTLPL